ncbi:MAG: molybdopterin molybdotransferase MoeA [Alteraurantiacibacter sp.]
MTPPKPVPLKEAQERLCDLASPLPVQMVGAADAVGRYLGQNISARRTQPTADLSAMDGYAVLAEDVFGPWTIIGESAAGHPFPGKLCAGQAARISTGAIIPDGAGAVLLQENATRDGEHLNLNGEGDPTPRHIRRAGFDFAKGDVLLEKGTAIGPAQLALAISGGHGQLPMHQMPSLAVLDSGDELSVDPENCGAHQIPASNGPAIAALARPFVSQIHRIGPVRDTMDAMLYGLDRASSADVIVTSGGASVGDHDLVRPALEEWGASIDFWRVAIKPGKPLMVARRGKQVILGLPGNPVSSFVTAYLFLLPLLRTMGGAREGLPYSSLMPCIDALPPGGKRTEFLRGRFAQGGIALIDEQDSSALRALAAADLLIRRDIDAPATQADAMVPCYRIQNGGIA